MFSTTCIKAPKHQLRTSWSDSLSMSLSYMKGHAASVSHRKNDISFFYLLFSVWTVVAFMKKFQTRPHWVRTLAQRGRGNQRLACFYFAFSSEQAVNLTWPQLIWAPATLALPWEKSIIRISLLASLSLPLPLPRLGSPWLNGGGPDWIILSVPFLPSLHLFVQCCHFSSVVFVS